MDKEDVSGKVIINLGKNKTFEHKGIKIELLGIIEGTKDKKDILRFISLTTELEPIGILSTEVSTYPFKFQNVQKQYDTYRGLLKSIKYLLRLTIDVKLKSLTWEQEFGVANPQPATVLQEDNQPIKLEVGIEDWLHLIFKFDKRKLGLKDIALGNVTFKKVGIRLKGMEIQIIKRETINTTGSQPENKVITKFEIMDGGPIKNETVPIRIFFKPFDLTPTMMNVNNRFSVNYFVNIVLSDVEDRKYFKQHEITLFRIEKEKKAISLKGADGSMPSFGSVFGHENTTEVKLE